MHAREDRIHAREDRADEPRARNLDAVEQNGHTEPAVPAVQPADAHSVRPEPIADGRVPSGTPEVAEHTQTDPVPAGSARDNTRINRKDVNQPVAPTPLDQGENSSDLAITQQIRKAVMGDDALSFTAKNVKIITQKGRVVLRGPVKTASERTKIASYADKVAGATRVDNQLEVAN